MAIVVNIRSVLEKYSLARLKKSNERINSRKLINRLISEFTEENLQYNIKQLNEYILIDDNGKIIINDLLAPEKY